MTNRQRIWTTALTVALTAGIVLIATAVSAQDVELPIETVFRGDPGDIFHVATIPAEPGIECIAVLESQNNNSVHPDNDILVGPVVFTNVETGTFEAAGLTFTSTGPIDVAVRLGGDGVFSAGFTLEVTCNPPTASSSTTISSESTTTSEAPPSSSTSTTSAAQTTTTGAPPVGGPATGGGACADGACAGNLSPLTTWLLIAAVWAAGAGLVWAYFRYTFGDTE